MDSLSNNARADKVWFDEDISVPNLLLGYPDRTSRRMKEANQKA